MDKPLANCWTARRKFAYLTHNYANRLPTLLHNRARTVHNNKFLLIFIGCGKGVIQGTVKLPNQTESTQYFVQKISGSRPKLQTQDAKK